MQSPGSGIPRPIAGAARRFLIWYVAAFIGLFGLLGVLVVARGVPLTIVPRVFKQAFGDLAGHWLFWLVLLVPYLGFLWLRSVLHGYRRGGARGLARSLALRFALPLVLVVGAYRTGRWYAGSETFEYVWDDSVHNTTGRSLDRYSRDGKHRGVHLFGGEMTETQDRRIGKLFHELDGCQQVARLIELVDPCPGSRD